MHVYRKSLLDFSTQPIGRPNWVDEIKRLFCFFFLIKYLLDFYLRCQVHISTLILTTWFSNPEGFKIEFWAMVIKKSFFVLLSRPVRVGLHSFEKVLILYEQKRRVAKKRSFYADFESVGKSAKTSMWKKLSMKRGYKME